MRISDWSSDVCSSDLWGFRPCVRRQKRRSRAGARLRGYSKRVRLLLGAVACVELADATTGVDDLLLARVERVRLAGGIEQHGRILDAVDRQLVLRLHRRTDDEHVICGTVLECDRAILGMDAVSHGKTCAEKRERERIED